MDPPRRFALNYSRKNIPIPLNDVYKKKLIEMAESALKQMRWRAFFFLRSEDERMNTGMEHTMDLTAVNACHR